MISTSTQIIGEKPQTVSGPLWGIIHPSVVLTLMIVSRAVREVIYAARHCLLGLQHQGELGRKCRGRAGASLPPRFSLPSRQPHALHTLSEAAVSLFFLGDPNAW